MDGTWLNYCISSYTVIHSWDGDSAGLRCIFSNYMLIHRAAAYISNRAGPAVVFLLCLHYYCHFHSWIACEAADENLQGT